MGEHIHLTPNLRALISYTYFQFHSHITYSSYLEHTQPLFDSLNILCFHKLVIQRISLIIFKNEVGLVPKPISQLFTRNSEYHDYNTRHSSSLHLSVGRGEAIYRSLAFMELTFGIFFKCLYPLMCHIYVLKK